MYMPRVPKSQVLAPIRKALSTLACSHGYTYHCNALAIVKQHLIGYCMKLATEYL